MASEENRRPNPSADALRYTLPRGGEKHPTSSLACDSLPDRPWLGKPDRVGPDLMSKFPKVRAIVPEKKTKHPYKIGNEAGISLEAKLLG